MDDTVHIDFYMTMILLVVVVPAALILLLGGAAIADRFRMGDWSVTAAARFQDVDLSVRRQRLRRLRRRALVVGLTAVLWFLIAPVSFGPTELNLPIEVVSPILIGLLVSEALEVIRRRRGRLPVLPTSAADGTGLVLQLLALCLALLAFGMYVLACASSVADLRFSHVTVMGMYRVGGQANAVLWAVTAAGALAEWVTYDLGLSTFGTSAVLFIGVPVALALLLDRFGRRMRRRDAWRTLAADPRPYLLVLRGFDEDRLRIRAVEERQGFLELLSPFNRPRFEEMLVERIGAFGPTIAIAPARHRLQDLGAAKVSF